VRRAIAERLLRVAAGILFAVPWIWMTVLVVQGRVGTGRQAAEWQLHIFGGCAVALVAVLVVLARVAGRLGE
jgi:hypothetical protein